MIPSLKSILTDECQCELTNNDASLKDQQSGMKVKLTGVPKGGLVFSVPREGKSHIGAVREKKDYKKSCDYLIFVSCSGHIDAYFIELKKTLRSNFEDIPEEGCNQIIYTIPVLEYLISMVNIHHEKNEKVNQYYAVIGEKKSAKLSKQGVKPIYPKYVPHKSRNFKIFHSSPVIPFSKLK